MKMYYLNAPASAGKTYSIQSEINRLIEAGDRVIFCQPTTRLIDETVKSLRERFPDIFVRVIHGGAKRDSVVGKIIAYLKNPYPEPHVLIITWEAFQRLEFIPNRGDWHLIVDEIPQALACFDENLPDTHHLITHDLHTVPMTDPTYSYLIAKTIAEIRNIAENKGEDKALQVFRELAVRLESKYWSSYVQTAAFDRLLSSASDAKKLTVFSFLEPSIFRDFRSVMIAGAHFEESILYHSFSKRGVVFHEAKHARESLRRAPDGFLSLLMG